MTLRLFIITAILSFSACQSGPKPIDYGSDMCQFCKMSIVDPRYGAELVTEKGRVIMFDAVECLVNFVATDAAAKGAMLYVNTYDRPGELFEAQTAHYLISQKLPSPMGGFLTAFTTEEARRQLQREKSGEPISWDALPAYVKTIRL